MHRAEVFTAVAAFLLCELCGSDAFSHSQCLSRVLRHRSASSLIVSPVGAFFRFQSVLHGQHTASTSAGLELNAEQLAPGDWLSTPGPFVGQPLRGGPWSVAEADYAAKLVEEFDRGALGLPSGVGLRSLLATALHCSPMRITKRRALLGLDRVAGVSQASSIAAASPDPELATLRLRFLQAALVGRSHRHSSATSEGEAVGEFATGSHVSSHHALGMVGHSNISSARVGEDFAAESVASAAAWERSFKLLEAFATAHGHCDVPANYLVESGGHDSASLSAMKSSTSAEAGGSGSVVRLGLWATTQRRARASGTLSPARVAKLTKLGFAWGGAAADKWQQQLELLQAYKAQHGHCQVPRGYVVFPSTVNNASESTVVAAAAAPADAPPVRLGEWCYTQRRSKAKGGLSAARCSVLEDIGFEWEPPSPSPQPASAAGGATTRKAKGRASAKTTTRKAGVGGAVKATSKRDSSAKVEEEEDPDDWLGMLGSAADELRGEQSQKEEEGATRSVARTLFLRRAKDKAAAVLEQEQASTPAPKKARAKTSTTRVASKSPKAPPRSSSGTGTRKVSSAAEKEAAASAKAFKNALKDAKKMETKAAAKAQAQAQGGLSKAPATLQPKRSPLLPRVSAAEAAAIDYHEKEVVYASAIQKARQLRELRNTLVTAARREQRQQVERLGHRQSQQQQQTPPPVIMDAVWAKAANMTVEELHSQLRAGRQATDDLVAMNAPLVLSVAKKYTKYVVATGGVLQPADLMQEATIGLIRAAEKFDPSLGHRFSTYATTWIRSMALASLKRNRVIALPEGVQLLYRKMVKLQHDADGGQGGDVKKSTSASSDGTDIISESSIDDGEDDASHPDALAEKDSDHAVGRRGPAALPKSSRSASSTFDLGMAGMSEDSSIEKDRDGDEATAGSASGPLSDEELAQALGVSKARVVGVKRAVAMSVSSYDRGVGENGETVLDLLQANDPASGSVMGSDGDAGSSGGNGGMGGPASSAALGLVGECNLLDEAASSAPACDMVRMDLENMMASSLTPSEALVLRLRFGLEDSQRRSEREVAELMKQPRHAIRAKSSAAFKKMRALPGARKLLESLEG